MMMQHPCSYYCDIVYFAGCELIIVGLWRGEELTDYGLSCNNLLQVENKVFFSCLFVVRV